MVFHLWRMVDGGWWVVDGEEGVCTSSPSTTHHPPSTLEWNVILSARRPPLRPRLVAHGAEPHVPRPLELPAGRMLIVERTQHLDGPFQAVAQAGNTDHEFGQRRERQTIREFHPARQLGALQFGQLFGYICLANVR